MKAGVRVLSLHIVAVCAFVLTQGCVTTESQGSGRGAGARRKGPWRHEHKGVSRPMVAQQNAYPEATDDLTSSPIDDSVIIESSAIESTPEPVYTPVATATPSSELYIVQKGDILSKIAVRFDTTTKTLISMNNLSNPDVLYVGQELRIPAGSGHSSYSPPKSSKSSVKKGGKYVIQKGDSLSAIAVAAGVSLNDIRSLNNIQGDKIFAGETLYIPSYGKVPSTHHKSSVPKKTTKPAPVAPAEPAPSAVAPAPLAAAPMAEPEVEDSASMSVDAVMDHLVYPGETLDDISRQYGVSKSEIMRMNNISDETAIKENQRLRIPLAE